MEPLGEKLRDLNFSVLVTKLGGADSQLPV